MPTDPDADSRLRVPRGWLLALVVSVALLLLPLLTWVLLPGPSTPPHAPPQPRATAVATTTSTGVIPRATIAPPVGSASAAPSGEGEPALFDDTPPTANDGVIGTVVDPDGKPVAGALVTCDEPERHSSVSTDDTGRFMLPVEASGCNVLAQHPQFSPERVLVRAGQENEVRLGRGGGIAGVVVDDRGAPITSFRLTVELYQAPREDLEAGPPRKPLKVDDPAGAFLWEPLQPGRYIIGASSEGRAPGRSDKILVEAGRTTRNVRIVLPRSATLVGTVIDAESRRPLAGATVRLDFSMGGPDPTPPATSDAHGAFSLPNVPPGPFSVRVERDGYKSRIVPGLTTRGAAQIRTEIQLRPRGDGGADSELEGIGAILGPTPTGIMIMSLVANGPAAQAGLMRGDKLLRIDGQAAEDMTLQDAIQRLRGPEGSRVSVSVSREGKTIEMVVTRARVER
jgi:hypothetical protein